MSRKHGYIHLLLVLMIVVAALCSCTVGKGGHSVLVVWGLSEDDPVTKHWDKVYDHLVRKLGYDLTTTRFYCNPDSSNPDSTVARLSRVLDIMQSEGMYPENILVQGDYGLDVILSSQDKRLSTTPIVSFGSHYQGTVSTNIALIKDSIDVEKNLRLMKVLWPESNHVVTELDWTSKQSDSLLRETIYNQMASLDTSKYLNNVKLTYGQRQMDKILSDKAKMGLYALSLVEPHVNINQQNGKVLASQFAFNPESSQNHVLLFKHDMATRQITENLDAGFFCTASPEAFEVSPNCVGGYLTPIDVALTSALSISKTRAYRTSSEWDDVMYLEKDFYVDWNVLRDSYHIEDIPSFINIRHSTYRDTNTRDWKVIYISLLVFVLIATLILISVFIVFFVRNRRINEQVLQQANNNVMLEEDLKFIMDEAGAFSWYISGNKMYLEGNPIGTDIDQGVDGYDTFFKEKVSEFLHKKTPGTHTIQIFGPTPYSSDPRWTELRMHVSLTENGIERHGVTVDIQEQKDNEAKMIESHRMLTLAQEKENFIADMSHEMRTPLNTVVGFSQIATSKGIQLSAEERKVMRDAVVSKSAEITEIINDMLTLAKMDNGVVSLNLERLRLIDLVEKTMQDYSERFENSKNIIKILPGPFTSTIDADRLMMITVLSKLLSNAIKFSPADKNVLIGWENVEENAVIFVRDFGIGIPEKERELIFRRFYKSDKFAQGTGLGLAIAKEYVDKMGGNISVESTMGKGTTFKVSFLNKYKGSRT